MALMAVATSTAILVRPCFSACFGRPRLQEWALAVRAVCEYCAVMQATSTRSQTARMRTEPDMWTSPRQLARQPTMFDYVSPQPSPQQSSLQRQPPQPPQQQSPASLSPLMQMLQRASPQQQQQQPQHQQQKQPTRVYGAAAGLFHSSSGSAAASAPPGGRRLQATAAGGAGGGAMELWPEANQLQWPGR